MIFNVGGVAASGNRMPVFSYTGDYELLDDGLEGSVQNWRLKLKTSGVLRFDRLATPVDVFLVGGGGGGYLAGGGGGYTRTFANQTLEIRTDYTAQIGAGGDVGTSYGLDGGTSSLGNFCSADGGHGGNVINSKGGEGGSGGGSFGGEGKAGNGGSDGSDGTANWYEHPVAEDQWEWFQGEGGKGQGTTTREFGESTGELYAGGGGGGNTSKSHNNGGFGGDGGGGHGACRGPSSSAAATAGSANTGGGGGGGNLYQMASMTGGSGVIVIRNHR